MIDKREMNETDEESEDKKKNGIQEIGHSIRR